MEVVASNVKLYSKRRFDIVRRYYTVHDPLPVSSLLILVLSVFGNERSRLYSMVIIVSLLKFFSYGFSKG